MLKHIITELKEHIGFTAIGAASGIVIMLIIVLANIIPKVSESAFEILHPLHVIVSALTTTAMYRKYGHTKLWAAILIGYTGSIGIASISDAIIPFLGGTILGIDIGLHIPFISTEITPFFGLQAWVVVNSTAIIGIIIGYFRPATKLPHMGHVLLSTWASMFYFTAYGVAHWLPLLPLVFLFLFLAVWLPCCISDIIFPLLFTGGKELSHHG
ncbi:hypothetical protein ACFLYQ_07430 [Chloroflexota bacterium]